MNTIKCVIPTLNSAETLEMTLLSLSQQPGVDLEIMVVDSGSTDRTLEICERWNVKVLYAEPGNIYHAINKGLVEGKAEWLAYLNSDDYLYPGSYSKLIEHGNRKGADVVYGNCDYVDEQGRFLFSFAAAHPEDLLPLFRLGQMGLAQPAAIFRRELYEKLNGFDESYLYKSDADFYIRAAKTGAPMRFLDAASVACFRLHPKQLSNTGKVAIDAEGERLFGDLGMGAGFRDFLILGKWRIKNSPHYLMRILRGSLLSRRLRLPRFMEYEKEEER